MQLRSRPRNRTLLSLAAGLVLAGTTASQANAAPPEVPSPSPKARVEQRVGVTDFTVEYSSPGVKGRGIWGKLVPYDEVWRAGANAVTTLKASKDFKFGETAVPAGTYAVFAIPGKKDWTLVLSSKVDAWGTNGYDAKNDVARLGVRPIAMKESRERLTFLFTESTDDSVSLDMEWEKIRVRVPLEVDTKGHVLANIDSSLGEAWRPHLVSARWLLENDGDMETALGYANASISMKPNWSNHWIKAQILGKMGDKAQAASSASEAQTLGKGDYIYDNFYAPAIGKAIEGWK